MNGKLNVEVSRGALGIMTSCFLITIDCLRADHLSCYGYPRPTTPNIDSVAKEAVVFGNAFSNGPYTTTSFPSIHTSTILLRYYWEDRPLPRERATIAEILQKNRYSTASFHSNPYLTSKFGYARGFSYFENFDAEPIGTEERIRGLRGQIHGLMANLNNKIMTTLDRYGTQDTKLYKAIKLLSFYYACLTGIPGARVDGATISEKAISWLKKDPNKFFIWLHYMDVHGPYVPPKKYRNRFCSKRISDFNLASVLYKRKTPELVSKEEVNVLIDLYDAGVCYVDECIGNLITQLKAMEIYDDSLIIITADHGEEFKEHGGFTHTWKLYNELLHVPLIMKMPNSTHHQKVNGLCSLIDLGPTILDVLNISASPSFEGASLLPMIKRKETGRPWVLAACGLFDEKNSEKKKLISLRTEEWKYISKEGEEDELYNLLSNPGEKRNLIKTDLEKSEELRLKLIDLSSKIHYDLSPIIAPDKMLRMRLKALGYV